MAAKFVISARFSIRNKSIVDDDCTLSIPLIPVASATINQLNAFSLELEALMAADLKRRVFSDRLSLQTPIEIQVWVTYMFCEEFFNESFILTHVDRFEADVFQPVHSLGIKIRDYLLVNAMSHIEYTSQCDRCGQFPER